MKILIISFLSLIFSETLVPNKKIKINAGEPSGIYCSNGNCIISSDDGNVYSFNPEKGSEEEKLLKILKTPRNWI